MLSSVLALVTLFGGALAVEYTCEDKAVLSTSFVGQNSDVKAETFSCSNSLSEFSALSAASTADDPTDVCGASCTTNCFTPSGGGPNPNDCQIIVDALLYDSQNIGALFTIAANTSGVAMTYATCETFIIDQASYDLTYCRDDWSNVVEYVAFNCQSTQNAHGGNCVATDERWFIQVQTATT
ncbi:hypothetical protein BJ138DRAFT_1115979 [Hygrophoropsis aurantiaca]|uniref:Uncharacterized protein n=1 Tax=Hygrophoropsis aurantiaca TaxID=72124 RepID=A0ACB8A4G8_9AGAM|nr:hypothetical protein BJ138DRAFT_1115979 [Hygrophoropsis aurantiaca]